MRLNLANEKQLVSGCTLKGLWHRVRLNLTTSHGRCSGQRRMQNNRRSAVAACDQDAMKRPLGLFERAFGRAAAQFKRPFRAVEKAINVAPFLPWHSD